MHQRHTHSSVSEVGLNRSRGRGLGLLNRNHRQRPQQVRGPLAHRSAVPKWCARQGRLPMLEMRQSASFSDRSRAMDTSDSGLYQPAAPAHARRHADAQALATRPRAGLHARRAQLHEVPGRSPDTATVEDLRNYQLHLVDHGTSPASLNAAISGLKFFFDVTLDRPK
jgi:hypothetical protein